MIKQNSMLKTLLLPAFMVCLLSVSLYSQPGSGTFQNPVLGGDYPDPSILRDGDDYYMTHSSFTYYPGLMVWHSKDMLNWQRISIALTKNVGSVWAPDLIKHRDKWYIYFPANRRNWVVTAPSPRGPWSDPVDLELPGFIDPGHAVGPDGKRYLFLSKGYVVELAEDGVTKIGEPKFSYAGWQFPKEWSTECFCLESPKMTVKNGYFYQTVAQGGTAGPATSHMVVSARSKSPFGPWENSPYNPIVRTKSRAERWWSQGHGTLVDDVKGNWWMVYHGYEKGFHSLGRQTLMLPIEWTKDGWFRVPVGVESGNPIRKPAGSVSKAGNGLSDDFSKGLGMQWQFAKEYKPERAVVKDGKLHFTAEGDSFANSAPLVVNSSDRRYEVIVEYDFEKDVTAGLTMFYNENANARISVDKDNFTVFVQKASKIRVKNTLGSKGFLRILNDDNEVSFYFSKDGKEWNRVERTIDATGYNHNVFGEFLSLRAGVYAFGSGKVVFDNFVYRKL